MFSFAANQPTRNNERVLSFLSVLFFSLFRAKTMMCILYIARKKRQRRGIYKFSLGISLSLSNKKTLSKKLTLSLLPASEKREYIRKRKKD